MWKSGDKNSKYNFLVALAILLSGMTVKAQQVPIISQYMFNKLILNPAYAGSLEQLNASVVHRSQWIGIKGSPYSQVLSIDGPVGSNVGIGFNLSNDHTGVTDQTDVLGNFSYKLGSTGLSFGLRAGMAYYRSNLSNVFVWQPDDPTFSNDIRSSVLPKFGFGLYYFDGLLYAGLSIPDLLIYDANKIFLSPDGSVRSLKRNYILNGGYTFLLNDQIHVEPSVLVKFHPNFPLLVDLNCNFRFSQKFLAGVSYRVNNAFVGLLQVKVMDKVKVGYAFDIYQPNVRLNYLGTHEIMLSYNLDID